MTSKTSHEPDATTTAKWESGELGQSLEHAKVSSAASSAELDDSLGLQLISIRLQRSLIERLKLIANYRGVAYQPLIRDQLIRFAAHELRDIFYEIEKNREKQEDEQAVVEQFVEQQLALKRA